MRIQEQSVNTTNLRWKTLQNEAKQIATTHLYELFNQDLNRFDRLSLSHGPLLMDYSKEQITQSVLQNLVGLAEEKQLSDWIARLFSGDKVNASEDRAAMHWALRIPGNYQREGLSQEVLQQVAEQRDKMVQI